MTWLRKKSNADYMPPKVSRWYRYDWQYGVDIVRRPFLRAASLIISLMPIFVLITSDQAKGFLAVPDSIWLAWGAAVSYVVAWGLLHCACPKFIREYRDYGEYRKREHSHRMIIWEYHGNIKKEKTWRAVVKEALEKGVAVNFDSLTKRSAVLAGQVFLGESPKQGMHIYGPINLERDIYLPVVKDGERIALLTEEQDPLMRWKEKELFWILYSKVAKEGANARTIFWVLMYGSIALYSVSVLLNILKTFGVTVPNVL